MSFFKTLLILSLTIFIPTLVATPAYAGFFMEPSIGYRSHTLKTTTLLAVTDTTTMKGPAYALRLGFRSLMGIDLNLAYDQFSGKALNAATEEKNAFTHGTGSVQLGVSALGAMKIYLGYGFMNELKIEEGLLVPEATYTGESYQAGLQFKLFSRVNLDLQYNLNQFKTVKGRTFTTGETIDTYFNKIDSQDYSIGVSTSF